MKTTGKGIEIFDNFIQDSTRKIWRRMAEDLSAMIKAKLLDPEMSLADAIKKLETEEPT